MLIADIILKIFYWSGLEILPEKKPCTKYWSLPKTTIFQCSISLETQLTSQSVTKKHRQDYKTFKTIFINFLWESRGFY